MPDASAARPVEPTTETPSPEERSHQPEDNRLLLAEFLCGGGYEPPSLLTEQYRF
jgi:hypothetical protein